MFQMADFIHMNDYIFAFRKLQEPGLSETDRQSYSAMMDKAMRSMNDHQRQLVVFRVVESEKKKQPPK
jgi:hypothetical protein